MEAAQKIEHYKEIFSDDPLYIHIKQLDLFDELFSPGIFFDGVLFEITYQTKQAAELLQVKKNQRLLNFLNRDDFYQYILIHRQGNTGYYIYDYKTLFQFKMILLLTDHGYTPSAIAAIIGIKPNYRERDEPFRRKLNNSHEINESNQMHLETIIEDKIDEKLSGIFKAISEKYTENLDFQRLRYDYSLKLNQLMYEKQQIQKEIDVWEVTSRHVVDQIADTEMNITIFKALMSTPDNEEKSLSFWEKLLGKKDNSPNKNDPGVKIDLTSKINQLETKHQNLILEKNQLDLNKPELIGRIKQVDQAIEELREPKEENIRQALNLRGEGINNDFEIKT
ncbi:hypothetical protein [Bacillus cihuensis]|uniref:hypothetical protein n=1 Tax=Bacillus cihuensis TaxID=1208599 RepID=UPI0004111B85|nr:hypothetical protein [Bacillus cihuensis]